MNIYYSKTVLYAYPHIEGVIEQIDELVQKKALCSINDYSPCIEIAEKILDFTHQKDVLIRLKILADKALSKFSDEQLDYLDYKYFKVKPKDYYIGFDASGRTYFRRQVALAKKFSERLEKAGLSDKWFESECLTMDFFKEMLRRVIEHEKKSYKNKPKDKKLSKSISIESKQTSLSA